MSTPKLHVLTSETWQVGLLPQTGMSTAFGRIQHGGRFIDFMRPTPEDAYESAPDCASYLLIPWSNRIRDARFSFRGQAHQLRVNFPDGTAIHGTAKDYPWTVARADAQSLVASFDSRDHDGVNFPFAFSARAEFVVSGAKFENRLSLKNESDEAMPAGFGHHPYFERTLAGAGEDDEVLLQVPCAEFFELDRCLPRGAPQPVDGRLDFRKLRSLGATSLDDALTKRSGHEPIRFCYPRSRVEVTLEFDPLFEQVIVYAPAGQSFVAVEPLTNANDGFNLYEQGIPGSGVFVLEPGQERSAVFSLVVT